MAMTVTATQGGSTNSGMGVAVKVLTGAAATQNGATASHDSLTAGWGLAITPHATGSVVYGAFLGFYATDWLPYSAATAAFLQNAGSSGVTVNFIGLKSAATTTASTPVTLGAKSATVNSISLALLEVLASGTLTEDASAPASSGLAAGTTWTSGSFTPPPGSLLVVMVSSNGGGTVTTMTVTGGGYTWTEQVKQNTANDGYTGIWTAVVPGALTGAAALSGSGTLAGAGTFAGAATLTGTGTLTATWTHTSTTHHYGTATLTGSGTLTGAVTGSFFYGATLSGTGTLSGTWTGTLAEGAALSGLGTLGVSGYVLAVPAALSGNGTLSVLQATGGLVFASPGAATPQAYPLSSQVMIAPPGSANWVPLGSIGVVTALTYSFVCPGGADKMTTTVMVPATYRNQYMNPGWQVRITRGGHTVWTGRLDEPVPSASGWTLTAAGDGNRGTDFVALYSTAWPGSQPDEPLGYAISAGLPWVNAGIGQPSGAWYGQAVDSGAQTITALLNLICTRGGLTWYANSQPGGLPGTDISVFPLPTVPNRLLMCTTPVPRTLGGDVNNIIVRYQGGTDSTSGTAWYWTTTAANAASVAAHGTTQAFIDISDAGTMTDAAAKAVGNNVLKIYQRASFAGPFTGHYGQLMNTGGVPIDPGTDQAATMCRLILTDYGYGGEVAPGGPITFVTGAYEWDDLAQTFTITPMQTLNQSLSGLLSMQNTVLQPITAAGA